MYWRGVDPHEPIPLRRYRKRRRPPFTDTTLRLSVLALWTGCTLTMAVGTHDPFIIVAAFSGVGMGGAIAIWMTTGRGRR